MENLTIQRLTGQRIPHSLGGFRLAAKRGKRKEGGSSNRHRSHRFESCFAMEGFYRRVGDHALLSPSAQRMPLARACLPQRVPNCHSSSALFGGAFSNSLRGSFWDFGGCIHRGERKQGTGNSKSRLTAAARRARRQCGGIAFQGCAPRPTAKRQTSWLSLPKLRITAASTMRW